MRSRIPRLSPLPTAQKRLLLVLLFTIPVAAVYYILPQVGFVWGHILYTALGGGLAIWLVIYNRGFVLRGKTAEDLDLALPLSEREGMIADSRRRQTRSAWALYLLLPILFTLLIDTVILFLLPDRSLLS